VPVSLAARLVTIEGRVMRRLVAAIERDGSMGRLAVYMTEAGEVEIAHETRQSESWRLKRYVFIQRGELARLLSPLLDILKDHARAAAEPEQGHASDPALVDPAGPEGGA
jgi:hypothetical protein